MKILFVVPPVSQEDRYGALKSAGAVYPSLGLASLAAVALGDGHQVRILDAEAEGLETKVVREIMRQEAPDLIGLQTFCTTIRKSLRLCRMAKEDLPGIITLLGGVHATLFPEDCSNDPAVDYVIFGEGELSFSELLKTLESGGDLADVAGLIWKSPGSQGGVIQRNQPRDLILDLDRLPIPARHLLPLNRYRSGAQLRGRRTVHMMTSRGCPFNCSYCASHEIFGRTFRFHSTERVLEEIESICRDHGADEIQFYDESFTVNRDRVLELCRALKNSFPRLGWTCFTRTDLVDRELLEEMKRSGCYQIFYGVESGVPRLLELVNKKIPLETTERAFRMTREAGIQITASFILTLPTETVEETEQTIRFGLHLDPEFIYWLTFVPYPGTRLSTYALETGRMTHDDWERYNVFDNICYLPEGRTVEEVESTIRKAYRRFFCRPGYLIRHGWKYFRLPPRKIMALFGGGLKTLSGGVGLGSGE